MTHVLAMLLITSTESIAMHREPTVDFEIDERIQSDGGVQYFYELTAPNEVTAALKRFRPLDGLSQPTDAYHVIMSRIVYTVERDVAFFTEARARDLKYIRAVAPEMEVGAEPDGNFRVAGTPSNRFSLTWFDAPDRSFTSSAALTHFFTFVPPGAQPASVLMQRNFDFARVLGWRTAERAVTFTAHVPLGPGRTRVIVCSMSLLHHLPPFFMGGSHRVFHESVTGAEKLISRLRSFDETMKSAQAGGSNAISHF